MITRHPGFQQFALLAIAAVLAGVLRPAAATAQAPRPTDPAYLSEMPTVERVMREFQGTDSIDTAARQSGAFGQLHTIIRDIAMSKRRPGGELTPDEKRLVTTYYEANQILRQELERSLALDRPRLFELGSYAIDDKILDQLLTRVAGPSVRAEYNKAHAAFVALHTQLEEVGKAQAAAVQAPEAQSRRELSRCLVAGRTPLQCAGDSAAKEIGGLVSLFNPAAKKPAAGLRMGGAYPGPGGFAIQSFGPSAVVLNCNGKPSVLDYTVERKGNRVLINLLQPSQKPIVLELTPDARLDGTGQQITVTQTSTREVAASTERGIDLATGQPVLTTTRVLNTSSTSERCSIGLLGPGVVPDGGLVGKIAGDLAKQVQAKQYKTIAGLRMGGEYTGTSGVTIEFHHDSAVVECNDAIVALPYTVERKGNQVTVNIQQDAKPILLELKPDGTLAGSGPAQVNGRVLTGSNAKGEPVFKPLAASCALGILSPASP